MWKSLLYFGVIVVSFGLGSASMFFYIALENSQYTLITAPSNRFVFVMLHLLPEWYLYGSAIFFLQAIFFFVLGRTLLFYKSYQRAMENVHWKTREAFLRWKREAEDVGKLLVETERDLLRTKEYARDFQLQLLAIDRIRNMTPRNEVAERKLLSDANDLRVVDK